MPARAAALALALLVALAAGLRLWGIEYGLPNSLCRPDEEKIVASADGLLRQGGWPPVTVIYPSLLIHVDVAAFWATSEAGRLAGVFDDRDDFLGRWPLLQYKVARVVSALFGVATVLATYALGRALAGSRAVGLLAALALATLYQHVRDSHFGTVDAAAAFFTTLALVYALRAAQGDSPRPWLLAGAAAGLAAATKYNAIAAFLPLLAVAALRARDGQRPWPIAGRLGGAAACATAAFAVASPSVLLRWRDTLYEVGLTRDMLYQDHGPLALWAHLGQSLPVGFGEPLCLLALAGLARGARRRQVFVLLAFILPVFVSSAATRRAFPRYMTPLAAPAAALAADAAWSMARSSPVTSGALALLLAGPGLVRSIAYDRVAARPDTRLQVSDWINQRYLPGTRVLVCHGYTRPELERRSRTVDCGKGDLDLDWGHVMITPWHPQLDGHNPVSPTLLGRLETTARKVAVIDPFRKQATRPPYFYADDAFYLPHSGLAAMDSGGPVLTVWELREAPVRPASR